MKKFLILLSGLVSLSVFAAEDGHALYLKKCAACHQAEGTGWQQQIPPLAGSPVLLGDEEELASTVLYGKAGMPSFVLFLNDEKLAAILSYARGSWGNAAPPVEAKLVADLRAKHQDRQFWFLLNN